jgi:hypothetical protein
MLYPESKERSTTKDIFLSFRENFPELLSYKGKHWLKSLPKMHAV